MSKRRRGPNESQKWYCDGCEMVTVHECIAPVDFDGVNAPGRIRIGSNLPAYRRVLRCTECYGEPIETVEMREWDVDRLVRQSRQLTLAREVLKKLMRALNTKSTYNGNKALDKLLQAPRAQKSAK